MGVLKKKKAFTLIEVLLAFAIVVVAIFAIINFLLVYSNLNKSMQARIKAYTVSNSFLNDLLSRNFNDPVLNPGSKTYVIQNITINYNVSNITRSGELILKEIRVNATYRVGNKTLRNINLWGMKYRYENTQ